MTGNIFLNCAIKITNLSYITSGLLNFHLPWGNLQFWKCADLFLVSIPKMCVQRVLVVFRNLLYFIFWTFFSNTEYYVMGQGISQNICDICNVEMYVSLPMFNVSLGEFINAAPRRIKQNIIPIRHKTEIYIEGERNCNMCRWCATRDLGDISPMY